MKEKIKNKFGKKFFLGIFTVLVFFVFSFISLFPQTLLATAGVPALINFQGRLLDSSGNLLGGTGGTDYCYKFSIYDAVSAGSKIWPSGSPSTMTINTREGVFNANVGDVSAGGDALDLAFTDDQAFINIEVATKVGSTCAPGDGAESFETLSPRQRVVSSAFAINSKTVGGFTPAQSATGSQIPALTSGSLVLGDTNPGLRVTGSNTLTFQSGVTGDIQFYSSSNKITSSGALTIAGGFTSSSGTITLGGLGGGGTQCLQVDNSGVVSGTGSSCGAGSVTWNSLTDPTGTQTLAFGDGELNAWTVSSDTETFQTITANSLTTGKVLGISSTSLTSGSLVDLVINSSTPSNGQKGINISVGGATSGNATTYGAYIANTNGDATGSNSYGLYSTVSGTSENNIGLYVSATNGDIGNYALVVPNGGGFVGIGNVTPSNLFAVGSSSQFQVNSSGDIVTPSAEALSITTGTTGALTLDTGTTGTINIGTGASGKTINIATNNTLADTLNIGSALDTLTITGNSSSAFVLNAVNVSASEFNVLDAGIELADLTTQGTATDEYCLTSETGGGALLEWQACGGGAVTWNSLTDPTGTQTLAFGDGELNAWTVSSDTETFQTITANSLTTGKVLSIASSSLTSGSLIDLAITGTGGLTNQKGINVSLSGTNGTGGQTTYGIYSSNSHTNGTNATNYAGYFTATGASMGNVTINTGIYATASGGDANYAIIVPSNGGDVGIGNSSPASLLSVGSSSQFQVNTTGAIIASTDLTVGITDGLTVNIDGDGSPTTDLVQIGSGDVSATNGVDALQITFDSANASGDAIDIVLSSITGNGSDTTNAIDVNAFSYTSSGGTDIVNGLNIGNLTESGTVTSTALNVGTGWDNIFSNGTYSLTSAGVLTVASCSGCGAGASTWNGITNPTGTQSLTFDDAELTAWTVSSDTETFQTITANSLTTGKVLSIASSSLTTGSLIDLAITGTGALTGQKGLNISLSGANGTGAQTTYGAYLSNTHTGTSTNVGLYTTASGGTNNYAAIFDNGIVGIGDTSPTYALDIYSYDYSIFQARGSDDEPVIQASGTTGLGSTLIKLGDINNVAGASLFTLDHSNNSFSFERGNVTIGSTTITSLFNVGSSAQFQVNSSGDILTPSGEALSITTGTTGALTLDTGTTGTINIGTGASGKTINIGTDNTVADTLNIGSALDTLTITGNSSSAFVLNAVNVSASEFNVLDSGIELGDLTTQGTATDEYCLTSETGGGALLEWQACGGGAVTWNSITDPTGTQTLAFGDGELNAWTVSSDTETFQTITANSLTTGKVLSIASSSITTGSLLDLSINSASGAIGEKGLNITLAGATAGNPITYGAYISNTNGDATGSFHYGLYSTVSGSAENNIAIYGSATGADFNYAANFANGDVLIANGVLNVANKFYVDTAGDITSPAAEALSITTGTTGALTLDSGTTGAVNLGTGNNAKTLNIGTGTAGNTFNIGTNNTTLDAINIGSALDTLTITGSSSSAFVLNAVNVSASEFNVLDSGIELGDLTTQGTATDEYCLTSETGGGALMEWQACGGGGGLTVGTTAIASGGTNRVLFENGSNVLSENANFTYDGTTLGVVTSSTTASNKALNISQTGATSGTDYGGYFSNTGGATTNVGLYTTASGGTTNLGLNVDAGQVLIGGTTLTSGTLAKLNIVSTNSSNGSTTAIAGIHGDYTFNNGGASSYVQVGNRFVFNNAPTTNANTMVGEVIRTVDNTTLANLVRGIEITSNAGSNTAGTNTGIRTTGATFGIQAITNGAAGSVSSPAAIFGESTGTTQGDILRLYTTSMTSAPQMAYFYHDTSTFTGNGITMDFATGSGTFSGNFVDFQKNNTTLFRVTNGGVTSIGFSTNQTSTSAVCSTLANATAPTADTLYELRDCGSTPVADYAEMYPVEVGTEFGDIVMTGNEFVNSYDLTNGIIDWNKIKGPVSKLVKSDRAYQSNVIGIVSDNYGDFSSTGYNIKPEDNPMPVALVGRIPVKITQTSEPILAGDYITTSSEVGKGMKAIKSGFVLGKALEDWNPGEETVMVFVEQGYYNGGNFIAYSGIDPTSNNGEPINKQILAKLIEDTNTIDPVNLREIYTDRVIAGMEVITPDLVADNVETNTLSVSENAEFAGLSNFIGEASFMNKVSFGADVEFKAPPIFNADTAGFATVLAHAKKVEVIFDKPYMVQPVVNASISLEDDLENIEENMTEEEINNFFSEDIKYVITNKTQNGFTININKESDKDIKFSWVALAVKDAKNFESILPGLVIENSGENNSSQNQNFGGNNQEESNTENNTTEENNENEEGNENTENQNIEIEDNTEVIPEPENTPEPNPAENSPSVPSESSGDIISE